MNQRTCFSRLILCGLLATMHCGCTYLELRHDIMIRQNRGATEIAEPPERTDIQTIGTVAISAADAVLLRNGFRDSSEMFRKAFPKEWADGNDWRFLKTYTKPEFHGPKDGWWLNVGCGITERRSEGLIIIRLHHSPGGNSPSAFVQRLVRELKEALLEELPTIRIEEEQGADRFSIMEG
jgi:hypothetical protein